LIAAMMHSQDVRTADDGDLFRWVSILVWGMVAVGAVLFAYRRPKTHVEGYRRVQRFAEAYFPRIGAFGQRRRHPKCRDVNVAATLPGLARFEAAPAWRDGHLRAAPPGNPAAQPAASGRAARRPF
jgi:hypothetical protein